MLEELQIWSQDLGPDAQIGPGMQEVEAGAMLEAEEQIRDRGERRALAGFVAAMRDMQPRALAETDLAIRQGTVALE